MDEQGAQAGVLAVFFELLDDLGGEFTHGFEDEHAEVSGCAEAGEGGQGKGCGLAGAGLGGADDVFAGQDDGDGFFLNGRGRLVA